MTKKTKLCKDCKYDHYPEDMYESCGLSAMWGEDFSKHTCRGVGFPCGPEGKEFKPKPTLIERIKEISGGGE